MNTARKIALWSMLICSCAGASAHAQGTPGVPGTLDVGFAPGSIKVDPFLFTDPEDNATRADGGRELPFALSVLSHGLLRVGGALEARRARGETLRYGFRNLEGRGVFEVAFPSSYEVEADYGALILFALDTVEDGTRRTFAKASPLQLTFDVQAGINNPILENGELRFAVLEGDRIYVSNPVEAPGQGVLSTLKNPGSASWREFEPRRGLLFDASGGHSRPLAFRDIKAVGFLFNLKKTTAMNDPILRLTQFSAWLAPVR